MVSALPATGAEPCEILTTFIDFSADPPATPLTRRVMGADTWRGYLMLNDGNGIRISNGRHELTRARFFCPGRGCPGLIRGDYDWTLYNVSTCSGCAFGIAAGGGPGRQVVWRWSTSGIRVAEAWAVEEPITEGAYVFARGGWTFAAISGWPDPLSCSVGLSAGSALVRFLDTGTMIRQQCLATAAQNAPEAHQTEPDPFPFGALPEGAYARTDPETVALAGNSGPKVMNGLELGPDHVGLIYSDGWVRVYEIVGVGPALRLEYRSTPFRGYAIYGRSTRADLNRELLITVPNRPAPWAEIWSIADPEAPVLLSTVPDVPCCYAAIAGDYAWTGRTAAGEALTIDITDPTRPVKLNPARWNDTRPREQYYDAVAFGDGLGVAAFAFGLLADLTGCDRSIFADGFESGDTSAWSVTIK
jgi:hypothetical protein